MTEGDNLPGPPTISSTWPMSVRSHTYLVQLSQAPPQTGFGVSHSSMPFWRTDVKRTDEHSPGRGAVPQSLIFLSTGANISDTQAGPGHGRSRIHWLPTCWSPSNPASSWGCLGTGLHLPLQNGPVIYQISGCDRRWLLWAREGGLRSGCLQFPSHPNQEQGTPSGLASGSSVVGSGFSRRLERGAREA
jgi:hypothetical protein